tara:strand:+ start:312 stop:1916 length:1605 start_codon:yes stop_codon:yes gene_type:complete
MSYQVLSRKLRPQNFDAIIGQNHITQTLKNAIKTDRIAHGYLFSGPRGVGKTSTARILAKSLNCEKLNNYNPCNDCISCNNITNGNCLDVQEFDGASNRGIDEIRDLKEAIKYPPSKGTYRVYIIDEVHMLTKEAFNALLKTLEEPPPHIIFIMATTDVHKIPNTILSRTQKFDFKLISVNDINKYIVSILDDEKIEYEKEGVLLIAQKADGSLRDSLSILDQVIAYSGKSLDSNTIRDILGIIKENTFLEVIQLINSKNQPDLIVYVNKIFNDGFSVSDFIRGFNIFIRNCLLYKNDTSRKINISNSTITWLDNECRFNNLDLLRILDLSLKYESKLRSIQLPQISLEILLMKLALIENSLDITQLLKDKKSIQKIENNHSSNNIEKNEEGIEQVRNKVSSKIKNPTNINKDKSDTITLESIKNVWPQVIKELEKVNSKISHFLEDVILKDYNNNQLIIQLLNENSFQYRTLEKDSTQIESVLNTLCRAKLKVTFKKDANNNNKLSEKKDNLQDLEHPLLDKVIEKFEGEIIR